jgi:hypothetical protein
MTKKDYIMLAGVLKANHNIFMYDLANGLADALATDNPRFDRGKFLAAAGVLPVRLTARKKRATLALTSKQERP